MTRVAIPLIAALALLAGCANRDPYERLDVWRPTGANSANLAAMVANPHDLIRGHGTDRQLTKAQELAVDRVWQDQPKGLGGTAATSSSSGGGSGGSGGSGGGSSSGSGGGTGAGG